MGLKFAEIAFTSSVRALQEAHGSRRAYARMAVSQANTLASHDRGSEAEQAYRLAAEIAPTSIEPVEALVRHLQNSGNPSGAQQALEEFVQRNPDLAPGAAVLQRRLQPPAP